MRKVRKAKKMRQPNVPLATGPVIAPVARSERGPADLSTPEFDYTQTRKDLARIGVLAGSFIAILVILSFIIK
jgi:hypothetical protein